MEIHDLRALAVRWSQELALLDNAGFDLLALRLEQLLAETNEALEAADGRAVPMLRVRERSAIELAN